MPYEFCDKTLPCRMSPSAETKSTEASITTIARRRMHLPTKKMGTVHKKRFFLWETRCSLSPSLYHYLHYHLQPESHDDRLCESLLSNCEVAPAFWLSFDNAAQPPPSNACNDTLDTTIITRILRSSNIRRIEFWVSPSRSSRVFKVLQCVNHK